MGQFGMPMTGAAEAKREPQLVRELNELRNALERVQGELDGLAQRLTPVLRVAPPASPGNVDKRVIEEQLVPAAMEVRKSREWALRLAFTVMEMGQRLEV